MKTITFTSAFAWRLLIVISAVAGLQTGDHPLAYFTSLTNVMAAGYFTCLLYSMATTKQATAVAPRLKGAITLYLLITALVAHFMLQHGANPLPGLVHPGHRLWNVSDFFVHYVTPVLVLSDWILFGPRRQWAVRDAASWLLFPLGYAALVLVRAAVLPDYTPLYPYPFLDVAAHGYVWVGRQTGILLIAFAALSGVLVGADRSLARLGAPAPAGSSPAPLRAGD
ncbi:Pr6Pr family membrane protein [Streptomyces vinaceus]|uniref:Pr6Pr family membrane protein n=1 Tax=Streptomyces vinaceus TaxID=1960 RepID=UPI0035D9D089